MRVVFLNCWRPAVVGWALVVGGWGLATGARAGEITLSGFYQGRNLFVQNPAVDLNTRTFCTTAVYVNEQKVMSNIGASAFEIDLSALKIDDAVRVRIVHRDGCLPKVLNARVLRSGASFQFVSFEVGKDTISWTTSGDQPGSMYFLEQFVNSNWLAVRTITTQGAGPGGVPQGGHYSVTPTHVAGTNRYRVKVQDKEGKIFYTREATYATAEETVTFYPRSVTDKIVLSRAVPFQVLSADNKVVRKGQGKEIALADLKTGVYYLLIGSRTEKFFKK